MGLGSVVISLMLVLGYLTVGSYIFQALEADSEIERQRHLMEKLSKFLDKYQCLSKEKLMRLLDYIDKDLDTARYVLHHNKTDNVMWDRAGSASFVVSVITTIGYGHITPKTPYGKIVCMIYAIIGIPLVLVFLTGAGEILYKVFGGCLKSTYHWGSGRRLLHKLNVVLQGVLGLTILFVLPCSVNVYQEKWSPLDAIYFCFITLTTIGFGDFIAGNPVDRDSFKQSGSMLAYRMVNLVWTFLGLAYISMIITAITNYYLRKTNGVQRNAQRRAKDLVQRVGTKLNCKTTPDCNSISAQSDLRSSGPFSLSVSSLQNLELADNVPSDTHIKLVAFSFLSGNSLGTVHSSEPVGVTSDTAHSVPTASRLYKSVVTTPATAETESSTCDSTRTASALCKTVRTSSAKSTGRALGSVKSSGTTSNIVQQAGTRPRTIQSSEITCSQGTSQPLAVLASGVTHSSADVKSVTSGSSGTTKTMASLSSRITNSSESLNSAGSYQPLCVVSVTRTNQPSGITQSPSITQSSVTRQSTETSSGDIQCTDL